MAAQGKQKLAQYLADAHSNETALIQTLNAHIRIAEPGPYRTRLERHLRETQEHEQKIRRRLVELGAHRSLVETGFLLTQNLVKNTLAMAKAPVDMVRGMDVKEKMLRNARDEAMTEIAEIGDYDIIERIARNLGDEKSAELAAEIRAEEEQMLEDLRELLPELTDLVVRSQVPLQERLVVSSDDLPIANYDKLTADEIVSRLTDMSQSDLRKIEGYERSNGNRKTVLDRVDSLKEAEPWPGYDQLPANEITKRLSNAPAGVREDVRKYESRHKNRTSIIRASEKELAPTGT